MMFVVDANMVFSALLSPLGRPAELLLSSPRGSFIAPDFLTAEIQKHYPKLLDLFTKRNDRTKEDLDKALLKIESVITFYSTDILPGATLEQAQSLVADIDPKDFSYVAFALFFNTKIWSGDKVLSEGLKRKGYDLTLTTQDVAIAIMK